MRLIILAGKKYKPCKHCKGPIVDRKKNSKYCSQRCLDKNRILIKKHENKRRR